MSLNKLRFNKNAVLQHATLLSQRKKNNKISSYVTQLNICNGAFLRKQLTLTSHNRQPLSLDGYYLHGRSGLYVRIFVPACFKNVVSRVQCSSRLQFYGVFIFKFKIVFPFLTQRIFGPFVLGFRYWFQDRSFYEMPICCVS